jgi:hypothetical protein
MEASYLPVQWEHREIIEEAISKKLEGKIFYFNRGKTIEEAFGQIIDLKDISGQGLFISLDSGVTLRIDRVITIFGKPGAAFDEYNAYADSCMDCMGGYEKEELDRM